MQNPQKESPNAKTSSHEATVLVQPPPAAHRSDSLLPISSSLASSSLSLPFSATELPVISEESSPLSYSTSVESVKTTVVGEKNEESRCRSISPSSSSHLSLHSNVITFDNRKAGLQNVDKTKTEEIIAEISKGSNFYRNEELKLQKRQAYLNKLLEKSKKYDSWCKLNPNAYRTLLQRVDEIERTIEKERCLDSVFAHLDMDMFYAAVEEKKNPALKVLPVGVGSFSMLSTTNYVARQYGVRAGMPGFIGKKLCPELVLVPLDFNAYKKEAMAVREITKRYDPHFCAFGWDELSMNLTVNNLFKLGWFPSSDVCIDQKTEEKEKGRSESDTDGGLASCSTVTPAQEELKVVDSGGVPLSSSTSMSHSKKNCSWTREEHFKVAERAMEACRKEILDEIQLTASVGIAPSPELAKMASNYQKPNGQFCLALTSAEEIRNYLRDKPVRSAQGIGKSTEFQLHGLGIETLGDIYNARYLLAYLFSSKTFSFLFSASIGGTSRKSATDEQEPSSATLGGAKNVAKNERNFFFGNGVSREGETDEDKKMREESSRFEEEEKEEKEESDLSSPPKKSVGEESTFGVLSSRTQLVDIARKHLHQAWEYVQEHQLEVQQVVVRVKHHTYQVQYSSKSVYPPTDKEAVLLRVLDKLLLPLLPHYHKFRLLGVRLDKLRYKKFSPSFCHVNVKEENISCQTEKKESDTECVTLDASILGGVQRTISELLSVPTRRSSDSEELLQIVNVEKGQHLSFSSSRKRRRSCNTVFSGKKKVSRMNKRDSLSTVECSSLQFSESEEGTVVISSSSSSLSTDSLSAEQVSTNLMQNFRPCENVAASQEEELTKINNEVTWISPSSTQGVESLSGSTEFTGKHPALELAMVIDD